MRVLLYASVDLNLIDGSSIWVTSLSETLGRVEGLELSILARTDVKRRVVLGGLLTRSNVELVNPWDGNSDLALARIWERLRLGRRLSPSTACSIIQAMDKIDPYDLLIIRDDETSDLVLSEPSLRTKLWVYVCDPKRYVNSKQRALLKRLVSRSARLLCQTAQAGEVIIERVGDRFSEKILLLPPMIPDFTIVEARYPDLKVPKLVYSGKFSPHYLTLETVAAFKRIRATFPTAEFFVFGDKFHNSPPVPGFENTVRNALISTPGINWRGGVSREEVTNAATRTDVATSWRHPVFDESVELSTKVLEYAAAGLPVIMNPNPVQAELFGEDYAGLVCTEKEFVESFAFFLSDIDRYRKHSEISLRVAKQFTFERVLERLEPHLREHCGVRVESTKASVRVSSSRRRVLFAGHKLNFAEPIIQHLQTSASYDVLIDKWERHTGHDSTRSRNLLEQADLVFCEWCLGNAVWYSEHLKSGQALVVRLHHQEMGLDFLNQLQWKNVDALIAICDHHFDELCIRFPTHSQKIKLIYNLVETSRFDLPKLESAEFNLGVLGIVPMRKSPHIAFEIFERLRKEDSRFTLSILGKGPSEHPWMRSREKELEYYHQLDDRIRESPHRNAVVFDPHTDDVPNWFAKIGFLLSTSEHEGSHQAVAEAMAAGTIPIVRDWKGAERLYPKQFVFSSTEDALKLIAKYRAPTAYQKTVESVKEYARSRFDSRLLNQEIEKLFDRVCDGL